MFFIRQGATHKVVIGPAVAVGDGFTPVTTLALNTADEAEAILHDSGTVVDISGYTFAAITTADGYYHLTLQSGISGTVGHMTVVINDDSLILPIRMDFTVLEEAVYDNLYAASAVGPLAANSDGSGLTEAGGTGDQLTDLPTAAEIVDEWETQSQADPTGFHVNVMEIGGTAQTANDNGADINAILADTNELQTDWANGGRLDLIIDATLADTNELQTDWANGGRLDLIVDATLADTNELQTDWANGGRLDLILDSIDTELTTVNGVVTTISTQVGSLFNGIISASGTVQDAAATTTSFKTAFTDADDFWTDKIVVFTSGNLQGQSRVVQAYAQTNGTFTFDEPWTEAPANGDAFLILSIHAHSETSIQALAAAALAAYDPPTNAEMEARTLVAANYFDPAADAVANVTTVGSVTAPVAITSNVKKNQALATFTFLMTDSTNHEPATGLTVTCTRSIDGAAFAAGTLANVAEVANGVYRVDFGAGDLNGNTIILKATATGADTTFERIVTQP